MCPAALILAITGALHATISQGAKTFEARLSLSLQEDLSLQAPTPIQRVVKLLEEMKAQLDKEAATDSEAYDKMVCWCETNEKAKTKAIEDAEAKIEELMAEVEMRAARDGESSAKIAHMKKEIAKQKEALATAVSIREKELAAFREEESETVQAVTMLKNAIQVLSKHQAGFVQLSPALQQSVTAALQWTALKHEEMQQLRNERGLLPLDGSTAPTATSLLALAEKSLGQASGNDPVLRSLRGGQELHQSKVPLQYAARVLASAAVQVASFAQGPRGFQSYAPQSDQIFGILTQMKEEFEANLSESQKTEIKAAEDFKVLKAAAEKQIDSNKAMLDDMEEEFGDNVKALSDAKEDLAATRESRGADVEFLRNLKLKCQDLEHEWKQRTKARGEELRAVSETIAMLTEDDARELFLKKQGTGGAASLLQKASLRTAAQRARQQAAAFLMRAARNLQARQAPDFSDLASAWRAGEDRPHEELAAVAVQVQLDTFAKVKKAIDDMVADLKKQQEEEVKFKAYCTAELNDNEKVTYETNQTLKELKAKISSLEDTIAKCVESIEEAQKEIKRMEVELKKVSEIRKEENGNFQEEVMDQRAVQNILAKAIDRMRKVYEKKESLIQQEPPVKFQPYKQNAGASPVIGLMEQIVEDSKAVEKDAMSAEQEAQKAYASFVVDSESSIKDLNALIDEKTKAKATAEIEKEETEASKDNTETELDGLAQAAADLHRECDFVLLNFDIRQKARLQEIEAMQGAKAFLSGMKDGN